MVGAIFPKFGVVNNYFVTSTGTENVISPKSTPLLALPVTPSLREKRKKKRKIKKSLHHLSKTYI